MAAIQGFWGKTRMKNYFSWKRFGSSAAISTRNEQPIVQVVAEVPQPSSSVATVLERDNLVTRQPETSTDMVLRTIAVFTPRQQTVDAALICSFAVPAAGTNYLALSLNESMGEEHVRAYIVALECEQGRYSVASSVDDHAWQQAFEQILDQGQISLDASWHYIDIGQLALPVTLCQEHASVKVNKAAIMALLFRLDAVDMGQAIEYPPVASMHCNEPVNSTAGTVQELSVFDPSDEQDEQLDEVQASLSGIVAMVQELEQRHSIWSREHRQLEERQNQLSEMERGLNSQSKDLASRYAALLDVEAQAADVHARLILLDEREAALTIRSQELDLGHQKLSANRARFSSIVKKFQVAVQLKGVADQNLKQLAVQPATGSGD